MRAIADAIGFNLVVISPTIALVLTALILLFFTITIESNEKVKQVIIFSGVVTTLFCVFLKFGLFLQNGVSSYFSKKILLEEFYFQIFQQYVLMILGMINHNIDQ